MMSRRLRTAHRLLAAALVALGGAARAGDLSTPHLGACGPIAGAFQLPGSDACLRLSGYVAADVGSWRTPAGTATGLAPVATPSGELGRSAIGTDARLSADVRIPTDLGPARVFVSLRAHHGALPATR